MSNIAEEINKRRTFAIISHPDAGKTTLTVDNNKYVVDGKKYVVNADAVIFNVEDDVEVSTMTKAELLAGDDIKAGDVLDTDTDAVKVRAYIAYVDEDEDGDIDFMAVTNFGGSASVDYAIVDTVKKNSGKTYITFVGDTTRYELDLNKEADDYAAQVAAADAGNLVTYNTVGGKVTTIHDVNTSDKTAVKTYTDGLLTLNDGKQGVLADDVVIVEFDGTDYTYATADKALAKNNEVKYVYDDTEEEYTLVIWVNE